VETISWQREIGQELVDQSNNVIVVVDDSLIIQYCNPAWDKFALLNGGEACIAQRVMGTPLSDYVIPELFSFYSKLFGSCRSKKRLLGFDYECSSAETFRLFRMQVFPFRTWDGLAIMNCLRFESEFRDFPHHQVGERYFEGGLAKLCAHCRSTKNLVTGTWDWVPELVINYKVVTHGICPVCRDYLYKRELELISQ